MDINFADVTVSLRRERNLRVMRYERSVICTPPARLSSYCLVNCVDDTLTDTGLTSFILNGRVKEKNFLKITLLQCCYILGGAVAGDTARF